MPHRGTTNLCNKKITFGDGSISSIIKLARSFFGIPKIRICTNYLIEIFLAQRIDLFIKR